MLFKSAVEAMTTLAADPRLAAKIGGLAILHTWGQALTHHPHIHCVVPGGGLSLDAMVEFRMCRSGMVTHRGEAVGRREECLRRAA
jgi:hypothetical protein